MLVRVPQLEVAKRIWQEAAETAKGAIDVEPDIDQIKHDVNALLLRYLPGDMTISQFEALACGIFVQVLEAAQDHKSWWRKVTGAPEEYRSEVM